MAYVGLEHHISPLSNTFHCVFDRTAQVKKKYQFICAFQSDRFTPDLPMFVNTKTTTFITLSCADCSKHCQLTSTEAYPTPF